MKDRDRIEVYDEAASNLLGRIKCFIFDLDGTVYLGDKVLKGSMEFFRILDKNNIKFKCFTNNSSKNAAMYIEKIKNMGYDLRDDMMLISNQVIISHIKNKMPDKKVFVLGNKYLKGDFQKAGIKLVDENADIVVAGFDTSLEYKNVLKACTFIRDGAEFLGVNPDFNCPVENGFMPDCGSICAMITASTGIKPEFFGKPSKYTLDYIAADTGFDVKNIAFVGDRLYTDIAIGNGNESVTILVLTGETKEEDLEKSDIKPTLVFDSLLELKNLFLKIS